VVHDGGGRAGGWQVPGVVEVVDKLSFDYDDRQVLGAGIPSAIA
jgi:hypothetical protein